MSDKINYNENGSTELSAELNSLKEQLSGLPKDKACELINEFKRKIDTASKVNTDIDDYRDGLLGIFSVSKKWSNNMIINFRRFMDSTLNFDLVRNDLNVAAFDTEAIVFIRDIYSRVILKINSKGIFLLERTKWIYGYETKTKLTDEQLKELMSHFVASDPYVQMTSSGFGNFSNQYKPCCSDISSSIMKDLVTKSNNARKKATRRLNDFNNF